MLTDRYRLEYLLGRGGMATVWRARDLRLGRDVAVKILDQAGPDHFGLVERFHREAHTVAGLAHPAIVRVFDFGTDDEGTPFLVMELVEGHTVATLLAGGALPLERAVSIAARACAGLEAAHAAGVVHRDIKPANLMVTGAGAVKILDFGIACLQTAVVQPGGPVRHAAVLGTGPYMAPEQGIGGPVDARGDLYSLGCLLYAMLTGVPPFSGESVVALLYQHAYQEPRPLRERRPEIPRPLEDLVLALLAKDPSGRPADAGVVREHLERLAEALAAPAMLPPAIPAARTAAGRRAGARGHGQVAGVPRARVARAARVDTPSDRGRGRRGLTLSAVAALAVLSAPAALFASAVLNDDGGNARLPQHSVDAAGPELPSVPGTDGYDARATGPAPVTDHASGGEAAPEGDLGDQDAPAETDGRPWEAGASRAQDGPGARGSFPVGYVDELPRLPEVLPDVFSGRAGDPDR